jgi:hypothetical protein
MILQDALREVRESSEHVGIAVDIDPVGSAGEQPGDERSGIAG